MQVNMVEKLFIDFYFYILYDDLVDCLSKNYRKSSHLSSVWRIHFNLTKRQKKVHSHVLSEMLRVCLRACVRA